MHSMRRAAAAWTAAIVMIAFAPRPLAAQGYLGVRSVHGVVVDESGAPLMGAVVKIENLRTLQIRSFVTRKDGEYRFHGLSTEIDYRLKAERDSRESDSKMLTRFDSSRDAVIRLKIPSRG